MRGATILPLALMFLSGCANLNSIYRAEDMGGRDGTVARTTLIDTEQRAINTILRREFVTRPDGNLHLDRNNQPVREAYATICAEKSPDTFSAQSGSLSGGLELPRATGTIAAAFAESAASIALRTQLTQAQAELLYRICEAYANRAISGFEVHRQLRRFQNTMVALLAIEQLTGAVQVQNVALTTAASATTDRAVIAAQRNLDAARAATQRAEEAVTKAAEDQAGAATAADQAAAAVAAAEQAGSTNRTALERTRDTTAQEKARMDARLQQATASRDAARVAQQRAQEALANAESGSANASGGAVPLGAVPNRQLRAEEAVSIADAVQNIVNTVIRDQQTTLELCHDVIAGEVAEIRADQPSGSQGQRGTPTNSARDAARDRAVTECWSYLRTRNQNAHEIDRINAGGRQPETQRSASPTARVAPQRVAPQLAR
ncbi:hypothetical protein [Falsiroseomonas stagni]|uniref:Uncharacterized protein n=1 Tax=Falsiroseomonas stagni DSM 19981 TaxID=1123062 RepID=A0A1I4CQI3_9PROT|nr:hypothetical protein [Falsiroseomonas stagni]SFK83023.1 hypothetical protein SAMN02745775_10876 [Falsiroseomonas stagni DSM 19981]